MVGKKPTLTSSMPGHKTRQNDESLKPKAPTSVQNQTRCWLTYQNLIFGTCQGNGWSVFHKSHSYLSLIGAFVIMTIMTMTTMPTMKKMTRTMRNDFHRWLPDEDLPSGSIPVRCSLSRGSRGDHWTPGCIRCQGIPEHKV